MNINKKKLEAFEKARENYLLAKALNDTNNSINDESEQEVLDENVFFAWQYTSRGKKVYKQVTKRFNACHLNDDDFKRFRELVLIKNESKGLILPYDKYEHSKKDHWNLSADCESRPLLREAEKVFIIASLDILPLELKEGLKSISDFKNYTLYQKFIDINLKIDTGNTIPGAQQLIKKVIA